MSKTTKITGISVNGSGMSMYTESGDLIELLQGDERLNRLMDRVVKEVEENGFCELTEDDLTKKEIPSLFDQMNELLGNQMKLVQLQLNQLQEMQGNLQKSQTRIISSNDFREIGTRNGSTGLAQEILAKGKTKGIKPNENAPIVAVVGDKVIPGMEKLANQFDRALKLGSPVGVKAFLNRIASVIDKRGHSVDDLLKFMESGDLPISDSGQVVAYKTLNLQNKEDGTMVDCHSGNVTQWVGSKVFMEPSMVDHNRRNDCSNGLHVARRQYLGGFQGNVLTVVLVNPEDFIAVPEYNANKVRVCAYHIVYLCTESEKRAIFSNNPMTTESETRKILGNIIAGNHVGISSTIEIGGERGTNLTIHRDIGGNTEVQHVENLQESALDTSEAVLDSQGKGAAKVDTSRIVKKTRQKTAEGTVDSTEGNAKGTIREQYDVVMGCVTPGSFFDALNKFEAMKKTKKKSLSALGFSDGEIEDLNTAKDEFTKLSDAIKAVKEDGLSQTKAAEQFGVNRKKLAKYL